MKKVIGGKMYNTETAEKLGEWSNGHNYTDFKYQEETLYRTKAGAYFLAGEGGAMSEYAQSHGNARGGGSDIRTMTEAEAREWAEEKMDADDYEKVFGEVEEA